MNEKRKARQRKKERLQQADSARWEKADLKEKAFKFPYVSEAKEPSSIHITRTMSAFDVFNLFLPEELLSEIWGFYDPAYWHRGEDGMILHGSFDLKAIYVYFAVYLWIMGSPSKVEEERRPLRRDIDSALESLQSVAGNNQDFPRTHTIEQLFSKFHLPAQFFDKISKGFRKAISNMGRIVAGDEKLFYFTGDSAFVRLVLSKPDKVGFWFCELTTKLKDGSPFLLDTFLSYSNAKRKVTHPVHQIIQKWSSVLDEKIPDHHSSDSILVFDSYYASKDSIDYLLSNHYQFLCSISPFRFRNLVDILEDKDGHLSKRGDTSAIYNRTDGELLVHHYDINANLGKKYVLSNAFHESPHTRSDDEIIPAYDYYSAMFNVCDLFNKALYQLSFNHKCGGGNRSGEEGHCHKFIMACLIKNMHNLFHNVENSKYNSMNFRQLCVELSKEIFTVALRH